MFSKMSACDERRQEPLVAARSVESMRQGDRWQRARERLAYSA